MAQRIPGFPAGRGWMAVTLLSAAVLAGCGKGGDAAGPVAGSKPAMPPAQVGVVTVQLQSVPVITELPGRLEAFRTAQVRARVAGVLQRRLFTEGSDVKPGQALFQIDPATYQAALDSALADCTSAFA